MNIWLAGAATAAMVATASWAQQTTTPAPAPLAVFHGEVQALSGDQLTIIAEGKTEAFALSDKVLVILNAAGTLESIKPGSYIATTNAQQADGSGVSVSLSVYDPSMASAGVNYLMPTGDMMTNGAVAKVVSSPGAASLDIDYGKGVRHVQVPAGSRIILAGPGKRDALVPGAKVTVRAADEGGKRVARYITVGVGGFAPA